jgi:hypothetical protein
LEDREIAALVFRHHTKMRNAMAASSMENGLSMRCVYAARSGDFSDLRGSLAIFVVFCGLPSQSKITSEFNQVAVPLFL